MTPRPALRVMILASVVGCASNPPPRATRVDREQRVTADAPNRSGWFSTLHALQRELAAADARRLDVFGPLRSMLCLGADAPLDRVAAAAQIRMAQGNIARAPTRLRRTAEAEALLQQWVASTTGEGDPDAGVAPYSEESGRRALESIERALVIERVNGETATPLAVTPTPAEAAQPNCDPHASAGTQGLPPPAVLNQLAVVLRRSAAQGMMFQRMLQVATELRTQRNTVAQGAPASLGAEFAAADRALLGVTARATMQQHESARTERWAQGVLLPEGVAAPEDTSDSVPDED